MQDDDDLGNDSHRLPLGSQPLARDPSPWLDVVRTLQAQRRDTRIHRTVARTLAAARLTRHLHDHGYQHALTRWRITWRDIQDADTDERTRLRHARRHATTTQQRRATLDEYAAAVATKDSTIIFQALALLELAGIDPQEEQ